MNTQANPADQDGVKNTCRQQRWKVDKLLPGQVDDNNQPSGDDDKT